MGTDACCAPQSGLGRDAGSPEKEPIHCLLEGHNLGGSCCGGEEPASSTLALPSNPSQPWPEGQTVPASPGALLPRSPSGCAGYVSGAASKCSSSDAPLKKKKNSRAHQHVQSRSRAVPHPAEEPEAVAPLGTDRGRGWLGDYLRFRKI